MFQMSAKWSCCKRLSLLNHKYVLSWLFFFCKWPKDQKLRYITLLIVYSFSVWSWFTIIHQNKKTIDLAIDSLVNFFFFRRLFVCFDLKKKLFERKQTFEKKTLQHIFVYPFFSNLENQPKPYTLRWALLVVLMSPILTNFMTIFPQQVWQSNSNLKGKSLECWMLNKRSRNILFCLLGGFVSIFRVWIFFEKKTITVLFLRTYRNIRKFWTRKSQKQSRFLKPKETISMRSFTKWRQNFKLWRRVSVTTFR